MRYAALLLLLVGCHATPPVIAPKPVDTPPRSLIGKKLQWLKAVNQPLPIGHTNGLPAPPAIHWITIGFSNANASTQSWVVERANTLSGPWAALTNGTVAANDNVSFTASITNSAMGYFRAGFSAP